MTHRLDARPANRRGLLLAGVAIAGAASTAVLFPRAAGSQPAIEERRADTPVGYISYLVAGQGPAIAIIHGIGSAKEDWRATIDAFSATRRVIAIDMLGFGGSDKTPAVIDIAAQVTALRAVLAQEGATSADVIGNSVGGWVAASLAANHPTLVRRLVLADAAGFRAMFDGPPPVNFYPSNAEEMRQLLAKVRFPPEASSPQAVQAALARLQASGEAAAGERAFAGLFASPRLEELLPRITAPTLVIWGAEDRLFPPALINLVAGGIPGAQRRLIGAAGHFPQLDNPAEFHAAVAAFLGP